MIRQIELDLFKCFKRLTLPVSPLTLLSGTNASGKSTVLQALVLLHQTIIDHEWSTRLQLNGSEIDLGTVSDIVDKVHGRREFGIGLVDDECAVKWSCQYKDDKASMSANVSSVTVDIDRVDNPNRLRFLFPEPLGSAASLAERLRTLTYITAERVGPRESYQLKDPVAIQVVGPCGENAVGLLYQKQDASVVPGLVIESTTPKLLNQVEARMRSFFPGAALTIQPVSQANMVTMGLTNSGEAGFHRPIHVGFGLTQILPIIVAALAAKEGDLLLIENPEVHLHPAGQAKMGQFLAEVAAAGIQVITETHSDHVLNGIRRSVKSNTIRADQVALHFFRPRDEEGEQVTSPVLDSTGNIDHWPKGFFDQMDKDLNYFAGWGD